MRLLARAGHLLLLGAAAAATTGIEPVRAQSIALGNPLALEASRDFSGDPKLGEDESALLGGSGAAPRRLSISAALINLATQVATNSEIRQLMSQWFGAVGEVFKGTDTSETKVTYYFKVPECVISVDFGSAILVGLADAAKIALAYTPKQNVIMMAFVEEAAEAIQVMKRPKPHIQFLQLPNECMVTQETTFTPFCSTPGGRCFMTRLDIHLTRITQQMLTTMEPVSPNEFVRLQMERGEAYDEVIDLLDTPTPVGRMLFNPMTCLMHCRAQAAGPDFVRVYYNALDHSIRVDAQASDGSWFRRKVIIPSGCGGSKAEDFFTTLYLMPEGEYKVLVQTQIARGQEDLKRDDNIEIKHKETIRPTEAYNIGEHDLRELYPNANFIPYETMLMGHFF